MESTWPDAIIFATLVISIAWVVTTLIKTK